MNTKITFAIGLAASLLVSSQATASVIEVLLDNGGSGLVTTGDALDEIIPADIGTPAGGPIAVVEIPGLNITVTGIATDGTGSKLNSLSGSFGIDSDGTIDGDGDDSDQFDATFNEIATFQFDKDVLVHSVDFVSFTSGEEFSFAGVPIGSGDVSGSIYTFPTPFEISANTDFSLFATSGTIGIEAFSIEVVPEPSSFALLGGLGLLGFARRRRSI